MGRRAISRDPQPLGLIAGGDPPGNARDHHSRRAAFRRRHFCRALSAAGVAGDESAIAVVGAHLSGMALNGELKAHGGRLLEATATAPDYKLYALDTSPPKPGMLRVQSGTGSSIELEVWALPAAAFGKFVPAIPPPRSIGTIRLADGRGVEGFLVEGADTTDARDISAFSGWRGVVGEPDPGLLTSCGAN